MVLAADISRCTGLPDAPICVDCRRLEPGPEGHRWVSFMGARQEWAEYCPYKIPQGSNTPKVYSTVDKSPGE